MTALVSLLAGANLPTSVSGTGVWKTGPLRRLKLWNDVPPTSRPACFLFEGGQETYTWSMSAEPKRVLEPKIFVYISAKDPSINGASLLNAIMDSLDAVLSPEGSDLALGRNTLGGTAFDCRIDGRPMKDPGDLDGDALLIVPVKIILP